MRRLKLTLEDLRVESFGTSETEAKRGTVLANAQAGPGAGEEDSSITGRATNCLSACYSQCMSDCWPSQSPCCL